jgi:hypothetical protein
MKYVIKIGESGYYGQKPFIPVPRNEAIVFDTMADARKQQNRLNGRLWKDEFSEIEPL